MKLSFSFSKVAAPKKQPVFQSSAESAARREVLEVSKDSGIVTEKTPEDIQEESKKNLVIPCRTLYTKAERDHVDLSHVSHDGLKPFENSAGLIPSTATDSMQIGMEQHTNLPAKKKHKSILMQINEAKKRGMVRDAPNQETRSLNPEDFGWAVLRGMGYDESEDNSSDVSKSLIGNRARLGIGVKIESLKLPTDR